MSSMNEGHSKNLLRNAALLLSMGMATAVGCSVDKSDLTFDDDEFARVSGDGDAGDGDVGDGGDGDVGGDGDGVGGAGGQTGGGTGGLTSEPECDTAGVLRCSGKQPEVCTGDSWLAVGDACEFVCQDGSCTGGCNPGDAECLGNTDLQTCNSDGEWNASICPNACIDGACGGSCTPGERTCEGNVPQICGEDAEWAAGDDCAPGTCTDGTCTGNCQGNITQCVDGDTEQACEGGNWGTPADCETVCLEGACRDTPCAPGDTRCDNATTIQTCNSEGQWGVKSGCTYVCGGTAPNTACGGVCKPGDERCGEGEVHEVCDGGQRKEKTNCEKEGLLCVPMSAKGELGCGECTVGSETAPTVQCRRDIVETCVEGAKWEKTDSCDLYCYRGQCITQKPAVFCSFQRSAEGCTDDGAHWECSGTAIKESACPLFTSCDYTTCESSIGRQ